MSAKRLIVSPTSPASFAIVQGSGVSAPASASYRVSSSSGNMTFSVKTPAWLTASPASGTVSPSGKAVVIAPNVNAYALGVGSYTGSLGFNGTTISAGLTVRLASPPPPPPLAAGYLLLEDGMSFLLQEDDVSKIIL